MDAVAYARFSSDNQNDLSIEAQMSAIKEAAKKNGDQIISIFEERGESGRTSDREQFMLMFDAIKTGALKVKKVYVYMFNRFMRNPNESRFFKMRLEALGVDVVSAMQPLPEEEYMANFMEGVIELTDKLTSDMIGIHVRSGMEELARKGYWTGGPAPFGYSIKEIDSREGHTVKGEILKRAVLVPNEAEAKIVRRIFELAASADIGGHRIYETLSREVGGGILGRKGKILGGRGVNAILRKPIYKGLFIYGGHGYKLVYDENPENDRRMRKARVRRDGKSITTQIEAWRLVSDEIWDAAQRNRANNIKKDFGHGAKKAAYLLTGIFYCGVCGNSVGGHWQQNSDGSNRYHYYRCRGAMNGCGLCSNKAKIRGIEIESAVVQKIEQQLFSDEFLNGVVDEIVKLKQARSAMTDKTTLEQRRNEISLKIANLTKIAALAMNVEEIGQQLAELGRERSAIDALLLAQAQVAEPIDKADIVAKAKARLGRTLELLKTTGDIDHLRLELKKWIESIRLDADGSVWIKWRGDSIFELLGLDPISPNGEGGTPFAVKESQIVPLSRIEPILPAAGQIVGFSGLSDTPTFMGHSGFSGFSGSTVA